MINHSHNRKTRKQRVRDEHVHGHLVTISTPALKDLTSMSQQCWALRSKEKHMEWTWTQLSPHLEGFDLLCSITDCDKQLLGAGLARTLAVAGVKIWGRLGDVWHVLKGKVRNQNT